MSPFRILVVDDDAAMRMLLTAALSDEGWVVRTAQHGREALALCEAQLPDLILLDLRMPELDGFGVLRELDVRSWGHVPVIVVSGERNAARDLDGRVARVMPKPFDLDELVHRVRAFGDLVTVPSSVRLHRLEGNSRVPRPPRAWAPSRIDLRGGRWTPGSEGPRDPSKPRP